MRTVGVVTVARSDYGLYRPILRRLRKTPGLSLSLFVGGMHLSPEFGSTAREIEKDGFPIARRVDMEMSSDSPEGLARSMSRGVAGFAKAFARTRPDVLVILGDRLEMFSAAAAAVPFAIPLAHIHGGESTEGLIDEAFRHAMTKMSHLHFVSTEKHRDRVVQMGEEPWRVTVAGAPGLDNLRGMAFMGDDELERLAGLPLDPAPLLVTYHPGTLEYEETPRWTAALMGALDAAGLPVVFTYPNADTRGRAIIRAIKGYARSHGDARAVRNLGTRGYFSLMRRARAMVGNSSSGIIEAASFGLPVVNVGDRQRGRFRGRNVLDAGDGTASILAAIRRAVSPAFRRGLEGFKNPYGDGRAAERIVKVLTRTPLDRRLLLKRFHELPGRDRR